MIKPRALLTIAIAATIASVVRAETEQPIKFSVATPSLTVGLTASGEITGKFRGRSELAGCRQVGDVAANKLAEGGYAFTRTMVDAAGHRCTLTDRFTPTKDSIRWEVEAVADGAPWTAPFVVQLLVPATEQTRFWTAWVNGGSPINGSDAALLPRGPKMKHVRPALLGKCRPDGENWCDPLSATPLGDKTWNYGNGRGSICIPIATVLEPASDTGLSLVVAPDQPLLWLQLATKPDGTVRFQHNQLRLGGGRKVKFVADIVAHEADWRGGLRWMVSRYAEFFNPPNPKADAMAGTASYSNYPGPLEPATVERLKRMAYRSNWVASFDFPYYGLYLPPVPSWKSAGHDSHGNVQPRLVRKVSYESMNNHCRMMKAAGFHNLSYFCCIEFGSEIIGPSAIKHNLAEKDWWTDANTYLFRRMPDAVLGPQLTHSWSRSVLMDPGNASFQNHLLEQAQRHLDKLPDSEGIAIDRLDWLPRINFAPGADDGIGWYAGGKAGRMVGLGWIDLLGKLGPLMHHAGKVIFVNCDLFGHRLDYMREVDGFYDEYGDNAYDLNGSSLLALRKPAMMWTHTAGRIKPDPDSYFQRHLHMGAYPTAPFPGNDHTILPNPKTDRYYLDYGPLLDPMRGKKWVLAPHCVECDTAKVNLFEVPGGYALPATFAGKADTVTVRVRNIASLMNVKCEVIHPGIERPVTLTGKLQDGTLELTVPVVRGCAMVRIALRRAITEPSETTKGKQ